MEKSMLPNNDDKKKKNRNFQSPRTIKKATPYTWRGYLNDNGIAIKNSTQNFPFGVSFIVGHSHYRYHRFQHKPHFISVEKTLDDVEWRGGRSRIQFPPLTFQVLTKLYSRRKIFKMNFQFTEHKKKVPSIMQIEEKCRRCSCKFISTQ